MNATIEALNLQIIEESIKYLTTVSEGRVDESDIVRIVAGIVESSGGYIDACSHCGAMPMTVNCNNAGCDV